ncbi:NAD(P)H-dependent oxidoreductase [Mucilaginibacter conchicola]|uniref:NAD(P)H-dependent oxidoreductase n=1 Tax=Mucilaginibacter conchicola TaxID=2303333 RepID=A0A372NVL2_9SPHI|nr:NADPH-dependent FMN reductase [Mucilaginibacter conchicola]RFZ94183.1 NAD(P)H-dependent oxidoreductase [Mucilaginibacter conchicola]
MPSILAIPGSLRAGSSNHRILEYIGALLPQDINYTIYEELVSIPPFDPGLDNDEPPVIVVKFREAIASADKVIICTPEYTFGVPGQLKNALDWTVSAGTMVDKPLALITASSVGKHAHEALLLTLGALSANIIQGGTLLIPFIRAKMNGEGNIIDRETDVSIRNLVGKVINA